MQIQLKFVLAGDLRVQMVWSSNKGGVLYHANRKTVILKLPPASVLLDRQMAWYDHGGHKST